MKRILTWISNNLWEGDGSRSTYALGGFPLLLGALGLSGLSETLLHLAGLSLFYLSLVGTCWEHHYLTRLTPPPFFSTRDATARGRFLLPLASAHFGSGCMLGHQLGCCSDFFCFFYTETFLVSLHPNLPSLLSRVMSQPWREWWSLPRWLHAVYMSHGDAALPHQGEVRGRRWAQHRTKRDDSATWRSWAGAPSRLCLNYTFATCWQWLPVQISLSQRAATSPLCWVSYSLSVPSAPVTPRHQITALAQTAPSNQVLSKFNRPSSFQANKGMDGLGVVKITWWCLKIKIMIILFGTKWCKTRQNFFSCCRNEHTI